MKIIAAIESPEVACRILDILGIVSHPLPLLPLLPAHLRDD
jgi:hypothetical protein